MHLKKLHYLSLTIVICLVYNSRAQAQLKFLLPKNIPDTNYIYNYQDRITFRVFTMNKYNNFSLRGNSNNNNEHINFYSNKALSIGFGAVYKIYNANISISVPKIKDFKLNYSKTRSIDLNTSMYGRKWVFDIYGQFYKGFFSENKSNSFINFYVERPDIIMNNVGVTAHYLTNNNKFSYRAFRINDEWQHKSSGTVLLSISSFLGQIHSNENKGLISNEFYTSNRLNDIRKKFYFQIGPGVGYAYNFVLKRNYFLLTSFSTRLLADHNKEFTVGNEILKNWSIQWGYTFLTAIGYQNDIWGINASYINTYNSMSSLVYDKPYSANNGYLKITAKYLIPYSKYTKSISQPLDYFLKK